MGHSQDYMDFWSYRTLKVTWIEENKVFVFIVSVYLCAWLQHTYEIFLSQNISSKNQASGGVLPVLREFNLKNPGLDYPKGQHVSCRTSQIVTFQDNEEIWATQKTDVFSYIL